MSSESSAASDVVAGAPLCGVALEHAGVFRASLYTMGALVTLGSYHSRRAAHAAADGVAAELVGILRGAGGYRGRRRRS